MLEVFNVAGMLSISAVYLVIVQVKGFGYSPGVGAAPEGYGRDSGTGGVG